jgi:Flp pilus assembly pilin Flp
MLQQALKMVATLGRRGAFFGSDRRAVTAVEYAIIAGIVAVALVTSVALIGPRLAAIFQNVASAF